MTVNDAISANKFKFSEDSFAAQIVKATRSNAVEEDPAEEDSVEAEKMFALMTVGIESDDDDDDCNQTTTVNDQTSAHTLSLSTCLHTNRFSFSSRTAKSADSDMLHALYVE